MAIGPCRHGPAARRAVPASCRAVPSCRPCRAFTVPRAGGAAQGTAHGPIFRAVPSGGTRLFTGPCQPLALVMLLLVRCLAVDASAAELDVVLLSRVQAAAHLMASRCRRSEQVPRGATVVVCGRRQRTERDVGAAVVGVVLLQAQRERHASTAEAPARHGGRCRPRRTRRSRG